jgi:hypothetical protein
MVFPGLTVEEEGDVQVMEAWVEGSVRRKRMAEESERVEEVGRILGFCFDVMKGDVVSCGCWL